MYMHEHTHAQCLVHPSGSGGDEVTGALKESQQISEQLLFKPELLRERKKQTTKTKTSLSHRLDFL